MPLPKIPAGLESILGDVGQEELALGQKVLGRKLLGHLLEGEIDLVAGHLSDYPGAADLLKLYAGKLLAAAHLATPTNVQGMQGEQAPQK
jgi:hypothetical protein